MNPALIWLLGLSIVLPVQEARSSTYKTSRVIRTFPASRLASRDALVGAQKVMRRTREYPHNLFAPGASAPAPKPLSQIVEVSKATGTGEPTIMKLAFIRIEFNTDSVGDAFTGSGKFALTPEDSIPIDPPPHNKRYFEAHGEALSRYYRTQSYGSLIMEASVYPEGENGAYRLSDPGDYGPWNVGQDSTVISRAERFVTDAILAADASGDINFSDVDGVVLIHAGADFQGDVNDDSAFDIPSFTLTFHVPFETSSGGVLRVTVIPETTSQDGLWGALNGVTAHEVGHLLGLPDLYNIFNGAPQVGWFSLMDSGENLVVVVGDSTGKNLYEVRGTTPTSLDPWSKLQVFPPAKKLIAGSSEAPFVDGVWEKQLTSGILDSAVPTVIASHDEYFLIENRVLDHDGNGLSYSDQDSVTGVILGPLDDPDLPGEGGANEYDWPIPGEGGVAIWHIDDSFIRKGLRDRGEINLAIGYRGVALEEADGIWDIGYNTGFPFGHPNDLYFLGNNTLFDPFTTPSSVTNSGAYSGITIQVVDPPGTAMTIKVQNPLIRPDWPFTVSGGVLEHMALTSATGEPQPLVAYRNDEAEEYGIFVPGSSFSGFHDQPLPNPVVTKHDFVFSDGRRDMLTATIDSLGRLVGWDNQGEEIFAEGRALQGSPAITSVSNGENSENLLLVASQWAVESWDGDGTQRMTWELEGLQLTSNIAVFPDETFVTAFTTEVCRFDLQQIAPVQSVTVPATIERVVIGAEANSPSKVFAFGSTRMFVILGDTWDVDFSWDLPPDLGPAEPILGDFDHDGRLEVAMADTGGVLWVFNQDGSPAVGWPRETSRTWTSLRSSDANQDGRLNLLGVDQEGLLHAFGGDGKRLPSFPRPFADAGVAPIWLRQYEGTLLAFGVSAGTLWSSKLPGSRAPEGSWLAPWGGGDRRGYLATPAVLAASAGPDLGPAEFLAYPNPTQGSDVEMRFTLKENEDFAITIVDAGGKTVDARLDFRGSPQAGENAVQWVVRDIAPGLYYCLLKRTGPSGSRLGKVKVAVLR